LLVGIETISYSTVLGGADGFLGHFAAKMSIFSRYEQCNVEARMDLHIQVTIRWSSHVIHWRHNVICILQFQVCYRTLIQFVRSGHVFEEILSSRMLCCVKVYRSYFYCYTVHVVELPNYYTNHCTCIKFTH